MYHEGMKVSYRIFSILLFLGVFITPVVAVQTAWAQEEDFDPEDYLSDDEQQEIIDEYRNQFLNDGQIDLENNEELQGMARELDEQIETAAELKEKQESSKTVYKYKKEQLSPEELTPRIWRRP